MVTRKGMGKGLGTGYKNLVLKDPMVHSLSAKGVKTRLNMMGLPEIRRMNDEASRKAMSERKQPYVVRDKSTLRPPFPFPFIGSYVPEGWEKTNEYFVDSSGYGSPGEPALTVSEFKKKSGFNRTRVPRYTNIGVSKAFFGGKTKGKSLHVEIVETPTETLLVGYGWAVYGARDKTTGKTTFYDGWSSYSRTTSKQLGQLGLMGADVKVNTRREV